MKQTPRKNKTNQSVVWPTTAYFTINELWKTFNPNFVEITLRVRLTNAIEEGKIAEIGCLPGGKGRPVKVFAQTPITRTLLERAKKDGINMVDNCDKLVNVLNVKHTSEMSVTTSAVSPIVAHA